MLVVTRKMDEAIYIGDDIKITIVGVSSDKVSIGVEAPRDITILRSELKETISENKSSAVQVSNEKMAGLAAILKKL